MYDGKPKNNLLREVQLLIPNTIPRSTHNIWMIKMFYIIYVFSSSPGELLAAFEMFEVGLGEGCAPLPPLPQEKDGGQGEAVGPILPVPPEIRPTLVKYR